MTRARGSRSTLAAVGCAIAAACASGGGALGAPGSIGGIREERVLVSSFANIIAVAASQRSVYAATPDAVAIYDRQFGAWQPPVSIRTPFINGQIALMAGDPVEDGVWIGLPGAVVFVRNGFDLSASAIVPGVPDDMLFDRRNPLGGAYVRSSGQWFMVSRTGSAMPVSVALLPPAASRIGANGLRDVLDRFPQLRNFAALLTRDASLISWPISSGTLVPDANEVWLGTRGGGLFKVDPLFNSSVHVPYGLLERGAGALALGADGVVVGGFGGDASRGGVTVASADLQHFRWIQGAMTRPLAGARARDIAVHGSIAWVATDRGLARVDLAREGDVRMWSAGNGLASDQALSVAASAAGAWVGTARGLSFIADSAGARTATRAAVSDAIAGGIAAGALLLAGDTLWVASDHGLLLLRGASPDSALRRVALAPDEPRLLRPIDALAASDSVVLAVAEDVLLPIDLRHGALLHAFDAVNISALRGPTGAAMDARAIWISGHGGVLVIDRATSASRFLAVGTDIPGDAYAVRLDAAYAWIATREGLLRIRRTSGGLAP